MNDNLLSGLTDDERMGLEWPMSETLLLEAAMCLWEAFTEAWCDDFPNGSLSLYRDKVGTVQARHDLMPHCATLHIAWHVHELHAKEDVLVPFDWEFAPWFLRNCLEFSPEGWIALKPDWLDRARTLRDQPPVPAEPRE